ncbi:MAG TPA: hypothetical protein VF753_04715 [Terriglobales bacterium]
MKLDEALRQSVDGAQRRGPEGELWVVAKSGVGVRPIGRKDSSSSLFEKLTEEQMAGHEDWEPMERIPRRRRKQLV